MESLDLVKLTPLMELTSGNPDITIGLIDGPVALGHPDLTGEAIREVPGVSNGRCADVSSVACVHGTFIAGMFAAKRESVALGICPGCMLLLRPIFTEMKAEERVPGTTPKELAQAIVEVVEAGARVINLSVALVQSAAGEVDLVQSLDYAAREGIVIIAAAGNQGTLGSSVITRHPWVVPVVAYDLHGCVMAVSNLGSSIGRRGVGAPGEGVTSVRAGGGSLTMGGTSVAAPFVTGTVALLWSCFPHATAAKMKLAISGVPRRNSIAPPMLDARSAFAALASGKGSSSL